MNIVIILLFFCKTASLYRILATTIFPSYSHEVSYQQLWTELALRGHQVTVITSHPVRNTSITNLKEIDYSSCLDVWENSREARLSDENTKIIPDYFTALARISRKIFSISEVKDLIKNSTFDLVIAEWLYPAMFGLSAVFKCPLVGIICNDIMDPLNIDIGRLVHPVVHPNILLPFRKTTNFWERLKSVEHYLWMKFFYNYNVYPTSNDIIQKYLGSNLPPVEEITKNVSLVFINTNFLFSKQRAITSNIIEYSGLHMKQPQPLPQELKKFLDDASNGVVYFSLGSNIHSGVVSQELRNIILKTFKELPYKVLWKFEEENLPISQNVKISKWLPQQDILAHKNVKVFITQGGLQSAEEGIRKRVPMIGMPFILDQKANVLTLVELGIAKLVDKSTITVQNFKEAITEVAENNMYQKRINELADLLEDEPVKALDKIIWGIEYVLRHKGAKHFRSSYVDYPWYQFVLLDIFGFVIICIITITLLIVLVLKTILRTIGKIKRKVE